MKRLILLVFGFSISAHAGSFAANPIAACSQLAQAQDAQVLAIAAEGRDQYDDAHANAIFDYMNQRKSGVVAGALPTLKKQGVLTDGLLFPLAQDFGDRIDVVSLNLQSFDPQPFTQAMTCARVWMRNSNETGHKLVLIGHSHGGSRVVNLAIKLFEEGIAVNTLVTIDALPLDGGTIARPPGVETHLNFYQNQNSGFFSHLIYRGQPVEGADNAEQEVTDANGHFAITASKTVVDAVKAQMEKLVGPAQVASAE